MKAVITGLLIFVISSFAVGCSTARSVQLQQSLALPQQLTGKAVVLDAVDPDYSRAVIAAARKDPGMGGISGVPTFRLRGRSCRYLQGKTVTGLGGQSYMRTRVS